MKGCHALPIRRMSVPALGFVVFLLLVPSPALSSVTPGCGLSSIDDRCEAWGANYDNGGIDVVTSLAQSPSSTLLYVTGYSTGEGEARYDTSFDVATVAYDPQTGNQVWASRYDGSSHVGDAGHSLALSPDGERVYVSGVTNASTFLSSSGDILTLAYDAKTGALLWDKAYGWPEYGDQAYSMTVGDGPNEDWVYVLGKTVRPETSSDLVTSAINGRTGEQLWLARYEGQLWDGPRSIQVSGDGDQVYIVGASYGVSSDLDYLTIAYDSGHGNLQGERKGGTLLWEARYDGPISGYDELRALAVSPDDSLVFSSGSSDSVEDETGLVYCGQCDIATVAYDATTGERRWVARYGGAEENYNDLAYLTGLAATPDGNKVIAVGSEISPTGASDLLAVAFDASTGDQDWVGRYQGSVGEVARGIAISPDGATAYVTGGSPGPVGTASSYRTWITGDAVTVAFRVSDGEQRWAARFIGSPTETDSYTEPNMDTWNPIVVSSSGDRVFVAVTFARTPEYLRSQRNQHDYWLVAYDA